MGTHSNGVNTNSYGSHPGMGAHPIAHCGFMENMDKIEARTERVNFGLF